MKLDSAAPEPSGRSRLGDGCARMNALLEHLNPAQREAVTHGGGPLLVLAGAGSGKTRVITFRIAHLVLGLGVDPSRIIAVTFTNKAAGEMRGRVASLLGAEGVGAWIGTFHALCLRILRRDGQHIGLPSGFNVYDTDDQVAVVRAVLRENQAEDSAPSARALLARISRAKNAMLTAADLEKRAFTPDALLLAEVFARYHERLRLAAAVDFDDLLLLTIALFHEHPDVLERYAERCEHLLVDEYQDTNRPQYVLVRDLSSRHGNVCVVGDEDQSIYRFRGAELRNILEFEADHPGAGVIKLEQNYRSTGTILRAAGALISRNRSRKGKTLWTENPAGEKVELFHAYDERGEAIWAADRILELEPSTPYENMAILYRTNAQSRPLEEILRRDRIPYQVVGSVQFYARKEVKDLLAYLKLAANPADDVSFRRIVNTPPRGIGDSTMRVIEEAAGKRGSPLEAAAKQILEEGLVPGKAARMLRGFLEFVDGLGARAADEGVAPALEEAIVALRYREFLERTHPGEGADRMENIEALVSAAAEYQEEADDASLQGFLDRSALVSDADEVGARPGVTLMTIHCAKGLEFAVVFLVGLEESLFPHVRSLASAEDMEEERRLCYVAMTRAREHLFLSYAQQRRVQGVVIPSTPSRFIAEVPEALLEEIRPAPLVREVERSTWPRAERQPEEGSSAFRAASRTAHPGEPPPLPVLGKDPGDGFPLGATVRHPSFGSGRILAREGEGKALKLTIHFIGLGSKKILPAYTALEVVRSSSGR